MYNIVHCPKTGAKMIVPDNDTGLRQAGIQNGTTTAVEDIEMMQTLLAFTEGKNITFGSQRGLLHAGTYSKSKNIKQAGTVSDIEMMQTMLEFGGLL